MDAFLVEQGVPKIAIQKLPFDLKKRIYLGESQIEVGEPTYGVFTDDYKVEYTLENGQVVMDQQSRAELRKLLNDEEAVANVLLSNEQAERGQPIRLAANVKTEQDAMDARKAEVGTYLRANRDEIQHLKGLPVEAALRSLQNWESGIVCIHISYSNPVSKKLLMYTWEWRFCPAHTLTDKVAMAWSGGFSAEADTFAYLYQGYADTDPNLLVFESSGSYTAYEPNVGIGTDIDIKSWYNLMMISRHVGLLVVALTKSTTNNSRESVVGRYYHKCITVSPSGSLSFSPGGGGASISISWSYAYDPAPDAADNFWAISK